MNSTRPISAGSRATCVSDGSAGTCPSAPARNTSTAGRAPVRTAVRADSPPHGFPSRNGEENDSGTSQGL
ncbi:hypothetical protein BJF78_08690 [Pseudonocardia sp. CNS-139]|nr:hypothetical protein BJF78_08690 [Pseudonocardia sp. CNS-139]